MASKSLQYLLAESRKKNLFFIGATQSLQCFSEKLRTQLSTNTSVQITGSTYPQDVVSLTRYRNLSKEEISTLKKHQFFVKYETNNPKLITSPSRFVKTPYLLYMKQKEVVHFKAKILSSSLYRVKKEKGKCATQDNTIKPFFTL